MDKRKAQGDESDKKAQIQERCAFHRAPSCPRSRFFSVKPFQKVSDSDHRWRRRVDHHLLWYRRRQRYNLKKRDKVSKFFRAILFDDNSLSWIYSQQLRV